MIKNIKQISLKIIITFVLLFVSAGIIRISEIMLETAFGNNDITQIIGSILLTSILCFLLVTFYDFIFKCLFKNDN